MQHATRMQHASKHATCGEACSMRRVTCNMPAARAGSCCVRSPLRARRQKRSTAASASPTRYGNPEYQAIPSSRKAHGAIGCGAAALRSVDQTIRLRLSMHRSCSALMAQTAESNRKQCVLFRRRASEPKPKPRGSQLGLARPTIVGYSPQPCGELSAYTLWIDPPTLRSAPLRSL